MSHDELPPSPGSSGSPQRKCTLRSFFKCVHTPDGVYMEKQATSRLQIERKRQESGGWRDRPSALYSKPP